MGGGAGEEGTALVHMALCCGTVFRAGDRIANTVYGNVPFKVLRTELGVCRGKMHITKLAIPAQRSQGSASTHRLWERVVSRGVGGAPSPSLLTDVSLRVFCHQVPA